MFNGLNSESEYNAPPSPPIPSYEELNDIKDQAKLQESISEQQSPPQENNESNPPFLPNPPKPVFVEKKPPESKVIEQKVKNSPNEVQNNTSSTNTNTNNNVQAKKNTKSDDLDDDFDSIIASDSRGKKENHKPVNAVKVPNPQKTDNKPKNLKSNNRKDSSSDEVNEDELLFE